MKHLEQRPEGEADNGEKNAFGNLEWLDLEKSSCGAREVHSQGACLQGMNKTGSSNAGVLVAHQLVGE